MSAELLSIGLPPILGAPVADAMAPWGPVLPATDHDEALKMLEASAVRVAILIASGLDDLTTAESIRTVHPSTLVCLLAPHGMTERLSVHCMHESRAQVIIGPPITAARIREQVGSFLPPGTQGGSAQAAAPGPAPAALEPEAPTAPTPVVATAEPDGAPDTAEELALAKRIAEEATGEIARLRASARRHQLAAEAAHQDLAQTRAQAAEARRMAQRAEAQRDAVTTERDNLVVDLATLQDEAAAARAEAGRLAQELGSLEAEQEERIAEADWGSRTLDALRARVDELEGSLTAAQQDLSTARQERIDAEGATRTAQAEAAALRAAGPGRVAELESQIQQLQQDADKMRETSERERADAHELRIALTRQQHELATAEAEASRLRDTVAGHDERAVVLVEGLRRAEEASRLADEARAAAEADAADARAQQLQDITWFMEQLRTLREGPERT